MTSPDGAFYSAEDADSVIDPASPKEKGEGAFYIWTFAEIEQTLGSPLAKIFAYRYGVEPNGNVENDPHGEFTGRNILYVRHTIAETAEHFHLPEKDAEAQLQNAVTQLLEVRSKRVRPHLDDKILTAWNALMISAFAKAAAALDEPRYLAAAQRATQFILARMYDETSRTLKRRFRDGDAAIPGFLDDYAFLIAALLDLYQAGYDPSHIDTALALASRMRDLFEDSTGGAFFTTVAGDTSLILRMKDDYDGAEPSGNSVALLDLLRLAHLTDRAEYRDAAAQTLQALAPKMANQPVAVPQMLVALDYSLAAKREVVIAGAADSEATRALLRELRGRFLPYAISLLLDSDATRATFAAIWPASAAMREVNSHAAAYVCQNHVCQLPTADLSKFIELLQ